MSQNTTVDVIIKVVVYGIPALLIVFGFFAYMNGIAIQPVTKDSRMMNLGIVLMVLGIALYIIEFMDVILSALLRGLRLFYVQRIKTSDTCPKNKE